jgi:hypothetical protein
MMISISKMSGYLFMLAFVIGRVNCALNPQSYISKGRMNATAYFDRIIRVMRKVSSPT